MTVMHGCRSHSVQIGCQDGKPLFYRILGALNNERATLHCESGSHLWGAPGTAPSLRPNGRPNETHDGVERRAGLKNGGHPLLLERRCVLIRDDPPHHDLDVGHVLFSQ